MADTIVFEGLQDETWKVSQTAPVGQGDEGITPDLHEAYAYPPKYQDSWPIGSDAPWDEVDLLGGSGSVGYPGSPGLPGRDGQIIQGFEGQLYYRIHVIPTEHDLGNVLQPETRNIEVWNAWVRTAKTLASIDETDTTGITMIEPGPTPFLFNPLASEVYTIEVSEDGPAEIAANFVFNFTTETPELDVIGFRTVAFMFCPERPIREGLEFKTSILEAFAGDERRSRGRRLPRQQFEYRYIITDPEARSWAHNVLAGHHGRGFGVPVWPMMRPLLADVSIGATSISVDTTNADFRDPTAWVSELVVLWRDYDDFEIVQVAPSGISPSSITIERPTTLAHTALETSVIPLQIMFSRDPVEWEESPNGVMFLSTGWLSEAVTDIADLSSLSTHDGLPVLSGYNFMENRIQEKIVRKYELLDYDTGAFDVQTGRTVTQIGLSKGFEAEGDANCWTMREILYGLNGRQTSFFLPSYRNDFVLAVTIGAGDTVIQVNPVGYERFIETADPYGDIFIELRDGTKFSRNITFVEPGTGTEKLTIDSNLGQEVSAANIKFFSYLYRVRFDSDKIEINHRRLSDMSVRIPVIGVKE